jgi:hypothetical protein
MTFGAWPGVLLAPPGRFGMVFLAGRVVRQEVEQRLNLLAAQMLIELTAGLRMPDRHDDWGAVQRVGLSRLPAGPSLTPFGVLGLSRFIALDQSRAGA